MIDPRLSWFAIGATCSAVLLGWPWRPRFSRYSRRGSHENCVPLPPAPPYSSAAIAWRDAEAPAPYWQRFYINNPTQIVECGGPCQQGPEHCNCGALWNDVYISNPLPYPTIDP